MPAVLVAVRLVFSLTVLGFGGAAWWIVRRGDGRPLARDEFDQLRASGTLVWSVGIAGIIALAYAIPRVRDRRAAASCRIVAWALGEMIALFGAVYYARTGHPQWYGLGGGATVAGFAVAPIPARAG